jgi:hypothetical protein
LNATASGLQDERLAQDYLQMAVDLYSGMHRALVDATCYVQAEHYIVSSISSSLSFHFGDLLGTPFVMVGKDTEDKMIISNLFGEAVNHAGVRAVSGNAQLVSSNDCVHYCRLVIVHLPVGLSFCRTPCFFIGIRIICTTSENTEECGGSEAFDKLCTISEATTECGGHWAFDGHSLDVSLGPWDSVSNAP